MELQQKAVLLVTIVLIALAVYIVFTTEEAVVEKPADSSEAEALLLKGINFGKGLDNYIYTYSEISDGYEISYKLTKKGNRSLIEINNPLSMKKVYFLENDTVLCIDYDGESVCSSVKNQADLENYIESVKVKFFDDSRMQKEQANMQLLLNKGYAVVDPEIADEGKCSRITYTIDFSGISLQEAALFNIGSSSPRVFNFNVCINNETGYMHDRTLTYEYQDREHTSIFELGSLQTSAPDIEDPENVTTGAIIVFKKEREQYIKLAGCYTEYEGEERNRCISTLALSLKRPDLCELAGERKDRCMVSIVPLTADESICDMVSDQGYRDDCYIEIAGAKKDESYCSRLVNQSKMELCQEAATPPPPKNESEDDFELNVSNFLNYVDQYEEPEADTANESNESG